MANLKAIETAFGQGRLKDGKAEDIRAAVAKLSHSTDNFAAKRMNRNIQRALTGQSVDDI